MNFGDLSAGAFEVPVVGHDVVGECHLLLQRQLRLDSCVGLGQGESIARDQPKALHRFLGAHDDQRLKRLVRTGFDQKCPLVEEVRRLVVVKAAHALDARSTDARMHDRVELFSRLVVTKHQISDLLAIEPTLFIENVFAELLHDRREPRRSRLDHFARQIVRVDHGYSEVVEHDRDGGFSARDTASQSYNRFHRGRVFGMAPLGQDDLPCATPFLMRAIVQRVHGARVTVDGGSVGAIERGLLVYLGAARGDGSKDVQYTADKIAGLRVFPNDEGKMSLSVADTGGAILVVSQFTLFGDVRRGRRPSFDGAADPGDAERLYLEVVDALRHKGLTVETGTFRAMMLVDCVVEGPVTIQIDSRKLY